MKIVAKKIEVLYGAAKRGKWDEVLDLFMRDSKLAQACCKFSKWSSKWTFLHQAAYHGHERAVRVLITLGANALAASTEDGTAVDVAKRCGHERVAALLEAAAATGSDIWTPVEDPRLRPASSAWNEAIERSALVRFRVAYGGAIIKIPQGSRYFVDSFERVLVGWHGTFDPPCGMDSMSMLDEKHRT